MAAVEIAPGVHRLGSEWVNFYLVEEGDRVTVLDAGLSGYWEQIEPALAGIGRELGDIEAVVLTHHHSDHLGCAERLRSETGARVLAPEGEAPMIRGDAKPGQPDGLLSNLWRPVLWRFLVHAVASGATRVAPVGEVETFGDGEVLEVPGAPRAIATPGHSPDHHSILFERHGVLFTGDAMASVGWVSGESGPQIHPFGEDRDRMPAALEALESLTAGVVAFGHGEPFVGPPAEAVSSARRLAG